jgi:hypothetical protein
MSSLNTLLGFWFGIAFYQIFLISIFLLVFWKVGWQFAIALLLIGELFHLKWWFDLKKRILSVMPNNSKFYQTSPHEFPALNLKELEGYTEMLEAMGFEQIIDLKNELESGFLRLFADSSNYLFACTYEIPSSNPRLAKIDFSFSSSLSNGWTLTSTNSILNGFSYMSCDAKNLIAFYPEISISDLFQIHLQRRQQIAEDLELNVLTDITREAYCSRADEVRLSRRESFKRKNIALASIESTLFELNPKNEWLGDYPKLAAKRKARGL